MFKKISILLLALSLSWLAYGGTYSSRSSSSSRSYSSGKSSSGSSRSYSSSSSGKSYSSGSKSSPSSSSSVSKSSSSSSKGFSFFGKAEKAQAKANSKETFTKYKQQNQPDSWRPAGYDYLKSQPKETYATRTTRQQTVFKSYYSQPQAQAQPQVDSTWNPFFWMWLLDRPNQQAAWVYNHRSEISDERYKELVAKNKDLETQIKALEDKKAVKDPSYAPQEIDKDLMYSDDYVKAVQEPKDDSDFNWLLWLVILPSSLGLLGWGVYAIFFKKRDF